MIYFPKSHGSYYGLHYNPTLSNSATRLADFATYKIQTLWSYPILLEDFLDH